MNNKFKKVLPLFSFLFISLFLIAGLTLLSGCGGGGGGGGSMGGGSNPAPSGPTSETITGNAAGGPAIAGATVQLCLAGTSSPSNTCTPVGNSTVTDANGNFTITYTPPSGNPNLYVQVTLGNVMLNAIAGPADAPSSNVNVNEYTTVVAMDAIRQGLSSSMGGFLTLVNPSGGPASTGVDSSLEPLQSNMIMLANALAACVAPAVSNSGSFSGIPACSGISTAVTPSGVAAPLGLVEPVTTLDMMGNIIAIENAANVSGASTAFTAAAEGMQSAIYGIAQSATSATGYAGWSGMPVSSPSSMPMMIIPSPAAPQGLTASPGNAQVALNWDSDISATSYNVYESQSAGGPYAEIASSIGATAYTVTGLTNGATYYFEISGVNSRGEGAFSASVNAAPASSAPISTGTGTASSSVSVSGTVNGGLTPMSGATVKIYGCTEMASASCAAIDASPVTTNGDGAFTLSYNPVSADTSYYLEATLGPIELEAVIPAQIPAGGITMNEYTTFIAQEIYSYNQQANATGLGLTAAGIMSMEDASFDGQPSQSPNFYMSPIEPYLVIMADGLASCIDAAYAANPANPVLTSNACASLENLVTDSSIPNAGQTPSTVAGILGNMAAVFNAYYGNTSNTAYIGGVTAMQIGLYGMMTSGGSYFTFAFPAGFSTTEQTVPMYLIGHMGIPGSTGSTVIMGGMM